MTIIAYLDPQELFLKYFRTNIENVNNLDIRQRLQVRLTSDDTMFVRVKACTNFSDVQGFFEKPNVRFFKACWGFCNFFKIKSLQRPKLQIVNFFN